MLSSLLRSLPYLVHTNRELGLMLAGEKPMASFVDGRGCFPEVVERYLRLFDRHVAERRQGELLGYADWMNDYWLEFIYGKQTV